MQFQTFARFFLPIQGGSTVCVSSLILQVHHIRLELQLQETRRPPGRHSIKFMGGAEEGLAASQILDKNDPTLLTWREIKDSYGSCLNFMLSFGLKPWNPEDCEEARAISRSFKSDQQNE